MSGWHRRCCGRDSAQCGQAWQWSREGEASWACSGSCGPQSVASGRPSPSQEAQKARSALCPLLVFGLVLLRAMVGEAAGAWAPDGLWSERWCLSRLVGKPNPHRVRRSPGFCPPRGVHALVTGQRVDTGRGRLCGGRPPCPWTSQLPEPSRTSLCCLLTQPGVFRHSWPSWQRESPRQ